MKRTAWSQGLSVTADGTGVVPLAGAVAVRLLADRVGLTDGMSAALSRRGFAPVHDRGRVWVDVATMLAAGGEAIADIDTLRQQAGVLGPVASPPTVWRTLDEVTPAALRRVEKARAKVRRHVWELLPGGARLEGRRHRIWARRSCWTWTPRWSRRTRRRSRPRRRSRAASASTRSGCGATTPTRCSRSCCGPETPASNHAGDHIDVLTRAIAQIPAAHRKHLLVRADGAGATHQLLDWLTAQGQVRGRRVEYSVGFPTKNTAVTSAITRLPARAWTPAVAADGEVREGAESPRSPGCWTCPAGRPGCGSSSAASIPTPEPSCHCSRQPTATATKPSPPTPASGSSPSWRPGTAPTPGSRTGSRPPKTPVWAGSRPASTPSTRHGCRSPRSPPTSSPGCSCSPSTATSPRPSRKLLRFRMLHVPARLARGADDAASASRRTGPGPPRSSKRSAGS